MGRGECKLGIFGVCKLPASYQQVRGGGSMGDKSGIWRFYRRVWKNIFYEWRDKERERGFLGGEVGKRERGEILGWVGDGLIYTIYSNKSELQ